MQLQEFRDKLKSFQKGDLLIMEVVDNMPINYHKFKMSNKYYFVRAHPLHIEVVRENNTRPDKIYYTRIKSIEKGIDDDV